jgi:phosphohistidine phosphatase
MLLFIMRHGLAEEPTPKGDDSARKLTAKGSAKISKAAAGLRAAGVAFNLILTSPIARAMETAELVAKELGGPRPKAIAELSTGTAPAAVLEALVKLKLPESVLVVGHEPTLSRLASLMLTGSSESAGIKLRQGGVIALEFPDRIEGSVASLRWMMTQRQLRQLRK